MRTFKAVMVTFIGTVIVIGALVTGFLFKEGIVKLEKREATHTETVMVNGEVVETKTWNTTTGCDLKIDVVDGITIGK